MTEPRTKAAIDDAGASSAPRRGSGGQLRPEHSLQHLVVALLSSLMADDQLGQVDVIVTRQIPDAGPSKRCLLAVKP